VEDQNESRTNLAPARPIQQRVAVLRSSATVRAIRRPRIVRIPRALRTHSRHRPVETRRLALGAMHFALGRQCGKRVREARRGYIRWSRQAGRWRQTRGRWRRRQSRTHPVRGTYTRRSSADAGRSATTALA